MRNRVTQEQVVEAIQEWSMRFNQKKTPEECVILATMYFEDLTFKDVSAKEFDLLRKEINATCRFFPSVAEIIEARRIFYIGVFEPTEADRRAAQVNPNYSCGERQLTMNDEMVGRIKNDFSAEQIGFVPHKQLR